MNREKNVSLDCKKLLWKSLVELNREWSSDFKAYVSSGLKPQDL